MMSKIFQALSAVLLALLVTLPACKTETEEETTSASMSGEVEFSIPSYVLKGETVTMSATGVIDPAIVSYKWYINGIYTDTLTSPTITVRFPDSIGVFTVTATAQANDYYVLSKSQKVITIDTTFNGSLTGVKRSGLSIVDERDGLIYGYQTLGELDWFTQNLGYLGNTGAVAFMHSPSALGIFGAFYTWEEAVTKNVCPEGWRVPDNEDWASLAAAISGTDVPFIDEWKGLGVPTSADGYMNEDRLWPYSPDNVHTNTTGWNALPFGVTTREAKEWSGGGEYGYWWSASAKNPTQGYFRYIYYDRGDFPMGAGSKTEMRASVRCVRTHPQS